MTTEHTFKGIGYITGRSTRQRRQDTQNSCHKLAFISKSSFTCALHERIELASMKPQKLLNNRKRTHQQVKLAWQRNNLKFKCYFFQMLPLSKQWDIESQRSIHERESLKDTQRSNIRETGILLNLRALLLNKKKI